MASRESSDYYDNVTYSNPHIRVIRLDRTRSPTRTFGFSLRGHREFNIGFFVANVEKGSEADVRGLRQGDEIYQVNGFRVEDAVHQELVEFICNQERITLRVRAVGLLPVKDYPLDPLTWEAVNANNNNHHQHHSNNNNYKTKNGKTTSYSNLQRITLTMAPNMKLGCGICKGPEWKPGIFVQFTKECGVARNAGLRAGDQIISCNGVDLTNIEFSEAVALMKQSIVLDLIIKTSEGADLFPTESSGYNSSASSTTTGGDQSPCWENQKRLSIVREESSSSSNDRKVYHRTKLRDRRLMKSTPNLPAQLDEEIKKSEKKGKNTTIIRLSENGTLINNIFISNYDPGTSTPGLENSVKTELKNSQTDIKTVKVEVYQSVTNNTVPPPPPSPTKVQAITNGSSKPEEGSLQCALFEEIKRRSERKDKPLTAPQENGTKKKPGSINSNKQHDALIEEFKLVHSRMFKSNTPSNNDTKTTINNRPKESQSNDYHLPSPGPTPTPDYDSTSCDSIERQPQSRIKIAPGTMGRMAAVENAKATGEILEIESIESMAFTSNGKSDTKFPQQYFSPVNSGPMTIKKANFKIAPKVDEFNNMKSSIAAPALRSSKTPERTKEKNKVKIMLPKDH